MIQFHVSTLSSVRNVDDANLLLLLLLLVHEEYLASKNVSYGPPLKKLDEEMSLS